MYARKTLDARCEAAENQVAERWARGHLVPASTARAVPLLAALGS